MEYRCKTTVTEEFIKQFIALPKKLYDKKHITQDDAVERAILTGTHTLSRDFTVYPFLVEDSSHRSVCRCILTCYPEDEKAYLGFFESLNAPAACHLMLQQVFEICARNEKKEVVGPVDASFWIKYRFKTNHFENSPYLSEPYNKPYYMKLWSDNGFEVWERYASWLMRRPTKQDEDPKCKKRYDTMLEKGYRMESPTWKGFDACMEQVYEQLIELYADFPCFTYISKEQFMALFSSLRYALDYRMTKLVYKEDKLVAFSINPPDLGNAVCGKITPAKCILAVHRRFFPRRYVLLYMGVDREHPGLGGAMAHLLKLTLTEKKCQSVTALVKQGKATANYYHRELATEEYGYVLMRKKLTLMSLKEK